MSYAVIDVLQHLAHDLARGCHRHRFDELNCAGSRCALSQKRRQAAVSTTLRVSRSNRPMPASFSGDLMSEPSAGC